jgi:hypothetical protein
MGSGMGGRGGCGCMSVIITLIVLALILSVISRFANASVPFMGGRGFHTATVAPSTVRREALPRNAAMDTGQMYTDNLGWIRNQNQLLAGMRNFHSKTGVRPHLYLTGDLDGNTSLPSYQQLSDFANRKYEEILPDEAHVMLVFFENDYGERAMYVVAGRQAQMVMDDEARNILMDFVDRYYYSDVDEEVLFSRAFDGTGQQIMTVTRSQWVPVLMVIGALLILFILFNWWKRRQEQKNLEAEQTERILSQNLETFGGSSDEASRLARQYEDPNNN